MADGLPSHCAAALQWRCLARFVAFGAVVALAAAGVPVEGVEQTTSGTLCDDACHDGKHEQYYYEYLVVDEIEFPAEWREGDEATVRVTFYSDSNSAEASRLQRVTVRLSAENGTLSVAQPERNEYNLDRGAYRTLSWRVTAAQRGNDTLLVHLDGHNTHEGGFDFQTDARQPVEVLRRLPDVALAVGGVTLTPAEPIRGQLVEVSVSVDNLGDAGSANLSLYLDEELPDQLLAREELALSPLRTLELEFTFDTTALGTEHTLIIVAEDIEPGDSNPDNHRLTLPLTVHEPGNLWIVGVSHEPPRPWFSESMELIVLVGNDASHSIETELRVNMTNPPGNRSREMIYPVTIDPGETPVVIDWKVDLPYTIPGNSSLTVEIDPLARIPEVDESDNAHHREVPVNPWIPKVELKVSEAGLVVGPQPLVAGLSASINITVANLGREVAQSNLTVTVVGEQHPSFELGFVPLAIPPSGTQPVNLTWDLTGWQGPAWLVLEVDELADEETHANNDLMHALTVLPPPRLRLSELRLASDNISWLFPVALTVELAELAGTPAAGRLWLEAPDGNRTGISFATAGRESQRLGLTFTPLPDRGDYELSVEAHGTTNMLPFTIDARDPREFVSLGRARTSPQVSQPGAIVTVMVDLEWGLASPATLELAAWLEPTGSGAAQALPSQRLTLQPGHNLAVWTLLAPAGEQTLVVEGQLGPGSHYLWLTPQNFTLRFADEPVVAETPGPPATMVLLALAAVALLRRRGVGGR